MAFTYTELPVAATAGGVFIHCDSSRPDDTGDGLTPETAKKTLSAGYTAITNNTGSVLALKRGEVWTDETLGHSSNKWQKAGASSDDPMWVITYGDEELPRPKIRTSSIEAWSTNFGGTTPAYLRFIGLDFEAYKRNPNDPAYDSEASGISGAHCRKSMIDVLFEDCRFRYFALNEFAPPDENNPGPDNLRFRRCTFAFNYPGDSHGQGIWCSSTNDLLFEECVFYRNGWFPGISGKERTIYNRDMYLANCTNVRLIRCITADGSSGGFQVRAGGEVTECLSLDNCLGITMGHPQVLDELTPSGSISRCVILGGNNIDEVSEFRGFGLAFAPRSVGITCDDNIVAMNALGRSPMGILFTDDDTLHYSEGNDTQHINFTLSNNIIYRWDYAGAGRAINITTNPDRSVPMFVNSVFSGNIFCQSDGGTIFDEVDQDTFTWEGITASNQTYYTPTSNPFKYGGNSLSYAQWIAVTNETGSSNTEPSFPDPNRDISTYMTFIGSSGSTEEFMTNAIENTKGNHNNDYTALNVINYVRSGFSKTLIDDEDDGEEVIINPGAPSVPIFIPNGVLIFTCI